MLRNKGIDNVCGLCDLVRQVVMNPKDGERYVRLEGTTNAYKELTKVQDCFKEDQLCDLDDIPAPEPVKIPVNPEYSFDDVHCYLPKLDAEQLDAIFDMIHLYRDKICTKEYVQIHKEGLDVIRQMLI